jgi:hypothetical protein
MRRLACLMLLGGCTPAAVSPPGVSVEAGCAQQPAYALTHAPDPRTVRTCPASASPARLELRSAHVIDELAGITYVSALARKGEDWVPVVAWLGVDGTLSTYPLAREAIQRTAQGRTLHLLGMSKDWKDLYLESVDVTQPDAPQRRVDQRLAGMTGGSLGTLAADDTHALIDGVFYRNGKHEPVTYGYDRVADQVSERPDLALQGSSWCDGQACVLVALDRAARRAVVIREPHGGAAPERRTFGSFPGRRVFGIPISDGMLLVTSSGSGWESMVVSQVAPHLRAAAALQSPSDDCAGAPVLRGRWAGAVACGASSRTLVRWDPLRGNPEAVEALPAPLFRQVAMVSHGSGILALEWEGGSGMQHGPEFRGLREYHQHWRFEGGKVSLLELVQGRWEAAASTPLCLSNARGEFSRGYTPVLMVRGAHAAVLLTTDGHREPAWLQPVRAACE